MDVIARIRKDHRAVEQLFRRFERSSRAEEKGRIAEQLVRELSIHSAVEEQLVYPRLRPRLDGAPPRVLVALEEHHLVKVALVEIEKMRPGEARYEAKVRVLADNVRRHLGEEERELLPALRRALSPAELRDLGDAFERARRFAPTRPHPAAPDEPPAAILADAAASAYDRGRQAVSRGVERALARGRDAVGEALRRGGRAAQRARQRLGRGLERAAGEIAPGR